MNLMRRGLQIPVLLGGAAINRRFGRRILFTEDGEPYPAGVFYCKDAFEGLQVWMIYRIQIKDNSIVQERLTEAQTELGLAPKARPQITRSSSVSRPAFFQHLLLGEQRWYMKCP